MRRFLVATVLALSVAPAAANDLDCSDPESLPQQLMNQCGWLALEEADIALNVAYKDARRAVKAMGSGSRPDGKAEADVLRDAQRAWITFRDLACDVEGSIARGGSLEPFLVSSCLARLTEQRTRDLRLLTDREDG